MPITRFSVVRFFASLLFISFITACGGGGGSDSGQNPTPSGPSSSPRTLSFGVNFGYTNACQADAPHPFAEVFLHDSSGSVVDRQTTDANGRVSFTRTESQMSVSVVTLHKPLGEAENRMTIKYFADLPIKEYSSIFASLDFSYDPREPAERVYGNMFVTVPSDSAEQSEILQDYTLNVGPGDNQVSGCKKDGEWQSKYALFANTENDSYYGAIVNDFEPIENTGEQVLDVTSVSQFVTTPTFFDNYRTYQLVDGPWNPNFDFSVPGGEQLVTFPNHDLIDSVIFYSRGNSSYRDENDVFISLFSHSFSTDYAGVLALDEDLSVPNLSNADTASLVESGQFNLSSVTDLPFVRFDFQKFSQGHTVDFRYAGSTVGVIPNLSVYTGYESLMSEIALSSTRLSVNLFDYANLAHSASALNEASFIGDPIRTTNVDTHYRERFKSVYFSFPIFDLQQAQSENVLRRTLQTALSSVTTDTMATLKKETTRKPAELEDVSAHCVEQDWCVN